MSAKHDEAEIRLLETNWMQAWVERDFATLERILTPDFELIMSSTPDRPLSGRAVVAAMAQYETESFAFEGMQVRLFGDIAICSMITTSKGDPLRDVDRDARFFMVDTWRRTEEGWRLAKRYSALAEAPITLRPL